MPFLAEFNLCDAFGWSWGDCVATPPVVREAFLMILEARGAAQQLQAEEAKRQAERQREGSRGQHP